MIKHAFFNTLYLSLTTAVSAGFVLIMANAITEDVYNGSNDLLQPRIMGLFCLASALVPMFVLAAHAFRYRHSDEDAWYAKWRRDAIFYSVVYVMLVTLGALVYLWPALKDYRLH